MMEFIYDFFGPYTWEAFALGLTFLETQICIMFFARALKKGELFPVRLIVSFAIGIVVCSLLAIWKTHVDTLTVRVLCYLLITLLNLVITLICYRDATANEL